MTPQILILILLALLTMLILGRCLRAVVAARRHRFIVPALALLMPGCTVMTYHPDHGGRLLTTANADTFRVNLSEGTLRADTLSHESIEAALRAGLISYGQAMLLKGMIGPVDDAVGVVGAALR